MPSDPARIVAGEDPAAETQTLHSSQALQTSQGLRLRLEAAKRFRARPRGFDHFQSNQAPRLALFRLIDHAHPALAEQAKNSIWANVGGTQINENGPRR
jgi:hypothetical protein